KVLLDSGVRKGFVDWEGNTALQLAVYFEKKPVIQLMLMRRADLELRDSVGRTALFDAVRGGNSEIAKLLVDAGADVNYHDNSGNAPVDI
ncbi:ankyrin repeat-containing domain protein, partial [Cladorrhinum sp. PSN332]